jgi:predicted metal-dependent HD superfamily phosphohydrolase
MVSRLSHPRSPTLMTHDSNGESHRGGAPPGWRALLEAIDAVADPPAFVGELHQRYAEPHRRYHGVAHLDALANLFEQVAAGPGWQRPVEVALALLFHDAVYTPGRSDNEARSAALARARLAGREGLDLERIAGWIEATAAHGAATIDEPDLAHLLDADVAILGAPDPIYDRYALGVREEFAPVVGEQAYRAGRRGFLRAQLDRPALFHSPWFVARYEAQARSNLARELAASG